MKATLLALLTLGSLALAADTITLSSPAGSQGQAGYTSFDFVLNSDWLVKNPTTAALTEIVSLTSLTVTPAQTWYNQTPAQRNNGSGVAIYEKSDNVWVFVGASNWKSGYGVNTQLTYDFSDSLTLSSGTKYTAVFYGYKASFDALEVGTSTLNDLSGLQNPTEANPVAVYGMKSLVNDTTADFALYGGTAGSLQSGYKPLATFTVENVNVPEPATGTLSLLALAGLCIRRRKHN